MPTAHRSRYEQRAAAIAAEHVYPVGTLPESDAVALFEERAKAVRPDLRANGEVIAICNRLDRLPLALELAAARVNVLSPQAILRARRPPWDPHARRPDLPLRQQTLRTTIAWSYELLDDTEQQAFARLGVFVGDARSTQPKPFAASSLDDLASLIDKSLVVREEEHPVFEARYRMLETIGDYATERLEEAEPNHATCGRHADWFLDSAERAYPALPRRGERCVARAHGARARQPPGSAVVPAPRGRHRASRATRRCPVAVLDDPWSPDGGGALARGCPEPRR